MAPVSDPCDWPVLTRYDSAHLRRIALPLGGIGTGTVSLGGRGELRDWELTDRPAKGFTPPRGFFAVRTAELCGGPAVTRALEGRIDPEDYQGAHGSEVPNHGLPRFRNARFEAAYPFGQVLLDDPEVPVAARLQAFNPLVPADAEASGIPGASLRYVLRNISDRPLEVTVCGSLPNLVGTDGTSGKAAGGRNDYRTDAGLAGVVCGSAGIDPASPQWGTMALAALPEPGDGITHRTGWADHSWGDSLLDFWDDLSRDGRLDERESTADAPTASLALTRTLAPGETAAFSFLITWHFPNRRAWSAAGDALDIGGLGPEIVGNHYATVYPDAWAVARELAGRGPELEAATLAFVRAVCGSDLPAAVREAALFNLSTLRTQTVFRTADGRMFGWEGCGDREGSCLGSCTHVWNYEPATSYLFGDLARGMRDTEFAHATDARGLMSFRVLLPLAEQARSWGLAAADGQLGSLVRLHRDWRLSGDDAWLRELWPHARRAMEFCWIEGGWDADADGVMEGCQHNTMDVEYYGPNPQMQGWYLAALRAVEEMARHLCEDAFAERCRTLFESGSAWTDEHLFNGEWYRHQIRPPAGPEAVAEGLRHPSMGARDLSEPELQLGEGCLVDQLVGQVHARLGGLGDLLDGEHVATTWDSVLRRNRRSGFDGHFNHMRSYVLGDETALLMASYQGVERQARPFPYFNEVMTGFEHTAAAGLALAGRPADAAQVTADIRERYDGRRRNPFDEAECGHHYARAMASWATLLALTGFQYRADRAEMTLRAAADGTRWFWSTGGAWGTAVQHGGAEGGGADSARSVTVSVLGGALRLAAVDLSGAARCTLPEPRRLRAGDLAVLHGAA